MKEAALTIMGAIAVIFVIMYADASLDDNERNQKIEATTSPIEPTTSPLEFISLKINKPGANVEVDSIQGELFVTYSLDTWMPTRSTGKWHFNEELSKIIPATFHKFPDINVINVAATAEFSDIRGHSIGQMDILRATFSRANAESIVWDHIVSSNLPHRR